MYYYKELKVWQKAIDLTIIVYNLTDKFPKSEIFGLTMQSRRSSCSIAKNIAEGSGRSSTRDFNHFLDIAYGSSAELETQLIISEKLNFITSKDLEDYAKRIDEIQRMITGLKSRNLKSNF
jgi:four helix bundle protein